MRNNAQTLGNPGLCNLPEISFVNSTCLLHVAKKLSIGFMGDQPGL